MDSQKKLKRAKAKALAEAHEASILESEQAVARAASDQERSLIEVGGSERARRARHLSPAERERRSRVLAPCRAAVWCGTLIGLDLNGEHASVDFLVSAVFALNTVPRMPCMLSSLCGRSSDVVIGVSCQALPQNYL